MKVFALLTMVLLAGCTGDGGQSSAVRNTDAGAPAAGQRMNSLKITADKPVESATGAGNRQSMTVTGGAIGTQIQRGSGNTQSMNVQAAGGNVTQRQSGSGNSQSMNIGVTDDAPAAAPATPGRQ